MNSITSRFKELMIKWKIEYRINLINKIDKIISFADHITIYHVEDKISNFNQNLQATFNLVEKFTMDLHMKLNVDKCETILFCPTIDKYTCDIRTNWKSYEIVSNTLNNKITNKETVKYLGIHLDKFLYYDKHVVNIISKAKKSFFAYKKLFYSKYLDKRVKILTYQ